MSRQDFTVIRGDTPTLDLELVLGDGTVPDLVDAVVTFRVENLFERTVDPDESSGEAQLTLEHDDTADCPKWRTVYRYDVQVDQDDGTVVTPMRGLFIVQPDVS